MYMQPIFDSQDIAKQLPNETKRFKTIHSMWKSTIANAQAQKKVINICAEEGLCDKIREANKNLEII